MGRLAEAALDVGADADAGLVIGVGVDAIEAGLALQGLLSAAPVRQGQLTAQAAVHRGGAAVVGERVGAAQHVVAGPAGVGPHPLAGGIAGAKFEGAALAVGDTDNHRAQALCGRLLLAGQGDGDAVIDTGVQQAALQLAYVVGVVRLAGLPRRQAAQPGGICPARRHQVNAVQEHQLARDDAEGGADAVVGMVDDHLAVTKGHVGIAALAHRGDDAALGAQDVGGPAGLAVGQAQHRLAGDLHARRGLRRDPLDLGVLDGEALAGRNLDHRLGGLGLGDLGLDGVGVIALRPQNGDRVLGGLTGAPTGLEAVLDGLVGLAHRIGDGVAQAVRQFALDGSLRRLCVRGVRRPLDTKRR